MEFRPLSIVHQYIHREKNRKNLDDLTIVKKCELLIGMEFCGLRRIMVFIFLPTIANKKN